MQSCKHFIPLPNRASPPSPSLKARNIIRRMTCALELSFRTGEHRVSQHNASCTWSNSLFLRLDSINYSLMILTAVIALVHTFCAPSFLVFVDLRLRCLRTRCRIPNMSLYLSFQFPHIAVQIFFTNLSFFYEPNVIRSAKPKSTGVLIPLQGLHAVTVCKENDLHKTGSRTIQWRENHFP